MGNRSNKCIYLDVTKKELSKLISTEDGFELSCRENPIKLLANGTGVIEVTTRNGMSSRKEP